jgi:hypothetical protein
LYGSTGKLTRSSEMVVAGDTWSYPHIALKRHNWRIDHMHRDIQRWPFVVGIEDSNRRRLVIGRGRPNGMGDHPSTNP